MYGGEYARPLCLLPSRVSLKFVFYSSTWPEAKCKSASLPSFALASFSSFQTFSSFREFPKDSSLQVHSVYNVELPHPYPVCIERTEQAFLDIFSLLRSIASTLVKCTFSTELSPHAFLLQVISCSSRTSDV